MSNVMYLQKCIECGLEHPPTDFHYTCQKCDGLLLVERDEEYIRHSLGAGAGIRNVMDALRWGKERIHYPNGSGVWRWLEFILPGFPIDKELNLPLSLREGNGDLFTVPDNLTKRLGLKRLEIKLEGQNPSGSFKDRGMPVAISEALRLQREFPELGIKRVACASTGDTSAAMAIYSAYVRDRLSGLVMLPDGKISPAQLAQAMNYGAQVIAVRGDFDDCMKLVADYCEAHNDIVLVNSKNAFRVVGQETIGLNIIHDLEWKVPDWIAIPAGNGGNLTALMIGLLRAKHHKIINRLPGIIVGQSAAANTLVRWQNSNYNDYSPGPSQHTIASAMNINDPVSFPRIRKYFREFDIHFYSVEEYEIFETRALYLQHGAPICTQSAVALHAIFQARDENTIKDSATVVSISTAVDTKFTDSSIEYNTVMKERYSNPPITISNSLAELMQVLQK